MSNLEFIKSIKSQVDLVNEQALNDFDGIDGKIAILIVLIGGVLSLFVQIIKPTPSNYGLFLYILIFGTLCVAFLIMLLAYLPRNYRSFDSSKIISEYNINNEEEYKRFLKEISTETSKNIFNINRITKNKANYVFFSLILFLGGIILSFCYYLIYTFNGG